MFRKQAILVGLISVAICATLFAVSSRGSAVGEPQLDLDMDITNGTGPCNIIDTTRSAAAASTFQVAVCLTNNNNNVAVAAFGYKILYDDTILVAPEVADLAPALDDNPDANVGTTTFGATNLGSGWDCTGGVGAFPKGDQDAIPNNGSGTAYSGGCGSAAGPNTLLTGVLGIVSFNVTTTSAATLTITAASVTDNDLVEIGSCSPSVDVPMICNGGTVNASVATATSTNTVAVPTNTNTPTPTNTSVPPTSTSTNTPIVPVDTATPTNTSVVPEDTATPTNTSVVPEDTATPTNTSVVPEDTATPTNTSVVPEDTATPTNTSVVPEDTATATNTAAPATNTPVATNTPKPQECLTAGEKLHLLIGILKRFGAREGSRHYNARYDVNHDGKINAKDFNQVLLTPTCRKHHHHFHWWWW